MARDSNREPRAAVDSNLFVSGTILKRGKPFQLLEAWRAGYFVLLFSDEQRNELIDVLSRPAIVDRYRLETHEVRSLFQLLTIAERCTPVSDLPVVPRDPKDAADLWCVNSACRPIGR